MTAQIVEIDGRGIAMLPAEGYQRLLDLVEDKTDIAAAEARRQRGEEYVRAELVDRIMAGESALKVWREHRGLTRKALAGKVGIGQPFLSMIERGERRGEPELWRSMAEALDVPADDIPPAD